MNFIGGRCDRKWRFSNEETAFGGVQNFLNDIFFNGGDVDENRHFIEGKVVAHYQKLNILNGGDVHENRHLIERKLVAHYQILNIFQWGRC